MFIYIILTIILFFLYLINLKRKDNISIFTSFLIIFLVSAFRADSIGIDLEGYIYKFQLTNSENNIDISLGTEWGFYYFNYLLFLLSENPLWFIFSSTVLTFFPLLILIKLRSDNPIFSIIIFFILINGFGFFLTGIRQSFASVIVLWAFFYFEKKKILTSISLILIASTVHVSAIICLFLLLLSFAISFLNKKLLYIILFTSIIIGFLKLTNFFETFSSLNWLSNYVASFSKYVYYMDYYTDRLPNFRGLFVTIIPSSIFLYFLIKYQHESQLTRLFFLGVVLTNIFASTPMITRYFTYATILQIITIPSVFPLLRREEKIIFYLTIAFLIFYFLTISLEINGIYNYKFYRIK